MQGDATGLTVQELFAEALDELRADDGGRDVARGLGALVELHDRGDRAILHRAIGLLDSQIVIERRLGVRVLAEIKERPRTPEPGWVDESVDALLDLAGTESNDEVLAELARALGYRGAARAVPALLRLRDHPFQPVRFGVAASLSGVRPSASATVAVTEALLTLSDDASGSVRDYALWSINQLGLDGAEIRTCLERHRSDAHEGAAREGRRGLRRLDGHPAWDDD